MALSAALSNEIPTGGALHTPCLRLLHLPRPLPSPLRLRCRPLPSPLRLRCRPLMHPLFSSDFPPIANTAPSPGLRSYAPDEPRSGADILVEALERDGVEHVFASPDGASMEIYQALTRSPTIVNHLLCDELGEIFAAEGFARSTGLPGVCIATSGLGAIKLVTGLTDAFLDSVPLVAVIGEASRPMIGTDDFKETPIVEVTRSITKQNYLVLHVDDIPRVVREAFYIATSGRPGPVLIDIPKDIQRQLAIPAWDLPMCLYSYTSRLPKAPEPGHLNQITRLLADSRKPVLYVGGGSLSSSDELRQFASLTGIPVASTLLGLGVYPTDGDLSLSMLEMHGTVANYAIEHSDLLLAFGVHDGLTDMLKVFSSRAKMVHVDIDPAEIGKNMQPHISICGDLKLTLDGLNLLLEESSLHRKFDFSPWREELEAKKAELPLSFKTLGDSIPPQFAIQVLDELTDGRAVIATGVGQHEMWTAQWYRYKRPRNLLSSVGLGAMGFGLPAAAGAAVGRPGEIVVDIDGDVSFERNLKELAMIRMENLPVKVMILNTLWEDRFYNKSGMSRNFHSIARLYNIPAAKITKVGEVRTAIKKMLDTPGPYLLDVVVPHQEHVLPMTPSGDAFKDLITEGDGRTSQ